MVAYDEVRGLEVWGKGCLPKNEIGRDDVHDGIIYLFHSLFERECED